MFRLLTAREKNRCETGLLKGWIPRYGLYEIWIYIECFDSLIKLHLTFLTDMSVQVHSIPTYHYTFLLQKNIFVQKFTAHDYPSSSCTFS